MALKRISSTYFLVDTKEDLEKLPKMEMGSECHVIAEAADYQVTSDGKWIKQVVDTHLEEAFENSKVEKLFGESAENMTANPGSAFGIAINKGDNTSIVDAMYKKGIGLYTFWISKGNPDLPADVIAKNSSCRGLCCVDTVKDTGWYGWIQLFDQDGYIYTRYIRNSKPTEWRK